MRWRVRRRSVDGETDPAASMALLTEVLDRPLDPGYESAAEQRVRHGLPATTSSRSPLMIATVVVVGFVLSVAAVTLRAPDPQDAEARSELATRVDRAGVRGDEYAARIDALRADISVLEQRAFDRSEPQTSRPAREVGIHVGAAPLVGPGVVVTLDDARDRSGDLGNERDAGERVLAGDLQNLVNRLWASGAEAVAVNEQRLTSTSAIRFAGEAIIVDFRGLNRPYVVRAIGDPESLAAASGEGGIGRYLEGLREDYGLRIDVAPDTDIRVPAAERLSTRVATVVDQDDESSAQEDP